jgi:hypothetical protein
MRWVLQVSLRLLECGDLSPLWFRCDLSQRFLKDRDVEPPRRESGDRSPHSKIVEFREVTLN